MFSTLAAANSNPIGSSATLWERMYENQTIILVGVVVLVHLIGIALLMGCMWKQTPKQIPSYRLAKQERELYKQSIAKHD